MEGTVELQRCRSKEAIIARVRNEGGDRVLCNVCLGFCLFCQFWKILDWVVSRREAQLRRRGASLKQLRAKKVMGKVFGGEEPHLHPTVEYTKIHRLFHEGSRAESCLGMLSNRRIIHIRNNL